MMKYFIYICVATLLITSCKKKESYFLKEVVSNEQVLLILDSKRSQLKDSLLISLPNEYQITINDLNLKYLDIDYFINKKYLSMVSEYVVYDKASNKPIFDFKPYLMSKNTFSIVIRERNHLIAKKDAQELLTKYNKRKFLNNLKNRDTINLISYDKFRKDNIKILKELRRIDDKIRITTSCKGEEFFNSHDFKIRW
ncbi:hypothetical protein [Flavobacterium sp. UBA4854]|uniref:hypothetical protein n=1 Tax=Flavobacterium sp. UBA4854 TaxID=1946548 RepID=UPI002579DC48|nr:hypothetical protein [Flavobacterium sp. UBA4854]